MHPVREYVYTPTKNLCVHTQSGETETLEYISETPNGLSYLALFNEYRHPKLRARESHVLPQLGVEVSRFEYRRQRTPDDFDYYIDIAYVTEQGERWTVRDLYLDVLVFSGKRAEILDTDEYLVAITESHLEADEAAYALEMAHTLLNKLAQHDYNLETYLQTEVMTLTWRKLKSTP